MESEKSGFVNEMSEIWRKMQVKIYLFTQPLNGYNLYSIFALHGTLDRSMIFLFHTLSFLLSHSGLAMYWSLDNKQIRHNLGN